MDRLKRSDLLEHLKPGHGLPVDPTTPSWRSRRTAWTMTAACTRRSDANVSPQYDAKKTEASSAPVSAFWLRQQARLPMSDQNVRSTPGDVSRTVPVWDLFVRIFHWGLVIAFFVAFFTEDDALTVHVWAGYIVGGTGPAPHRLGVCRAKACAVRRLPSSAPARSSDTSPSWSAFRAPRHLGHSPAGRRYGSIAACFPVGDRGVGVGGLCRRGRKGSARALSSR